MGDTWKVPETEKDCTNCDKIRWSGHGDAEYCKVNNKEIWNAHTGFVDSETCELFKNVHQGEVL